jgi:hypothetical protein
MGAFYSLLHVQVIGNSLQPLNTLAYKKPCPTNEATPEQINKNHFTHNVKIMST